MERDFECAGMCRAPLFYINRDATLENGLPTHSCDEIIFQKLSGPAIYIGCICLLTGLIALVGFIGSFPLYTPYNDDEDIDLKDK